MLRVIAALCVLLVSTVSGFAQAEVGGATLNGAITDATGAAVPAAKVTVANHDTGLTRTTTTNENGLYAFPKLPVGTYELAAEKEGFKVSKRTGVALTIG